MSQFVVITHPGPVDTETGDRITEHVAKIMGLPPELVLLLPKGMTLSTVDIDNEDLEPEGYQT